MLLIITDIHLLDRTCGKSIPSAAFQLFVDRLKELALNACRRVDGEYRLVKSMDILLFGDTRDILHSASWLEKNPGEPGYVRPWTNYHAPEFIAKVREIIRRILKENRKSISIHTCLSYNNGECQGCRFETWSRSFSY
jgi:hypothetical protein